jgi:hypothetical protein
MRLCIAGRLRRGNVRGLLIKLPVRRLYSPAAKKAHLIRRQFTYGLEARTLHKRDLFRGSLGLFFAEDVSHAADLGAYAAELLFKVLVATVEVVDAVEDGLAVGDEGGQDERGGGAEVGAHDGGGLELGFAADGGGTAGDGDVGAHADELLDVHEAVFEDVFGDGAGAFGLGAEGHELGLHVGGEAGILLCGDVGRFEVAAGADADVVDADVDLDAALLEF